MATNRFDVGLNPIQIGTPIQVPFEELVTMLGAQQGRYDQSKAQLQELEEKQFQNLSVDTDFAAKARQDQIDLVDNLLQMNQGDLAKSAGEIEREVRKFGRRFGPAGDIGAMQTAYVKAQEEFKKVDDSDLPSYLKDAAKDQLLYKYGNVMQNSKQDAFGNTVYNQFGQARIPKYIDVNEEALKLAKEVPLEKLAQTTGWYKKGGYWFKDSSMRERVTQEDIVEAVTPFVMNNPRVQDYLGFEAGLQTYRMGDTELAAYNEDLRNQTFEANSDLLERKGEIVGKLTDPSKFKSTKEYQHYINKVLGDNVVAVDGVIGEQTKKMAEQAVSFVKESLTPLNFEQQSVSDIQNRYVQDKIRGAVSAAATFYEQDNITKKDQDMKMDSFDLAAYSKSLEKQLTIGDLTPSYARQMPFEDNPLQGIMNAKVKSGYLKLNTSEAADAMAAASYALAGRGTFSTIGASISLKILEAWNRTFNRDVLTADAPEIQRGIENQKIRHQEAGIPIDDKDDNYWLNLVVQDSESKLNAAGQQYYNVVNDAKAQKEWEEIWADESVKRDDKTPITNPILIGRKIRGTERKGNTTIIDGAEFRKKLDSGPISYAGTNYTVASPMEYGTDVIQIGEDQFYVEPSPTVKMKPQYFANRTLAAAYSLGDTEYFDGPAKTQDGLPVLAKFKSEYNAATDGFDVKIQSGGKWIDYGSFTKEELLNIGNE
jgi:hypothetical protein